VNSSSVPVKTPKGADELETRRNKLDQKLRALLIMVNGKSSVAEIAAKFGGLDTMQPLLDRLEMEGYVKEAGPQADPVERLKRARVGLSSFLTAALGPAADDITGKIDNCRTLEDLKAYLESRRAMFDDALGKGRRDQFWAQVKILTE
jgi:hypothetical protein